MTGRYREHCLCSTTSLGNPCLSTQKMFVSLVFDTYMYLDWSKVAEVYLVVLKVSGSAQPHCRRAMSRNRLDECTKIAYYCWKDSHVVSDMLTAHPDYQNDKKAEVALRVKRLNIRDPIAQNSTIEGVDKSDQYLSNHNVLRKTLRY